LVTTMSHTQVEWIEVRMYWGPKNVQNFGKCKKLKLYNKNYIKTTIITDPKN